MDLLIGVVDLSIWPTVQWALRTVSKDTLYMRFASRLSGLRNTSES